MRTATTGANGYTPPPIRTTEAAQLYVYLLKYGIPTDTCDILKAFDIDGIAFCLLSEQDLREMNIKNIAVRKHIIYLSSCWRQYLGIQTNHKQTDASILAYFNGDSRRESRLIEETDGSHFNINGQLLTENKIPLETPVELDPKPWKTIVSFLYAFMVTGITSFVMVLAHERLPDMTKYPPLPDLFLENLPHIKWAFLAAEGVGLILALIWIVILIFHRYRMILVRRFFALIGTVFLLRSITMIITSLSVPGLHLTEHCTAYKFTSQSQRFFRVFEIWLGLGMSIRGIQTCGDYMFSGHTICLTLLNFFITEYAPSRLQWLHTFSWVLNLFGIFFILASHEHYSIDVFVAVYISSRLFLYYHCLANNRILHQNDKERTMIWFPLFSFFEYDVCGIVPNIYEWPFEGRSLSSVFSYFSSRLRPACSLNNRRDQPASQPATPRGATDAVQEPGGGGGGGVNDDEENESQQILHRRRLDVDASQHLST